MVVAAVEITGIAEVAAARDPRLPEELKMLLPAVAITNQGLPQAEPRLRTLPDQVKCE